MQGASDTAFSFTVTALDQSDNKATGYTGKVHFTSSDAAAVLPANATLTNGMGTFFPATLKTAGTQTITATDTVTATIIGTSGNITVLPSGDINGDGKNDIFDALMTLQYALNLIPHDAANSAHYLAFADVAPLDPVTLKPKGDGKIDIFDALILLQRAVNLVSW